MSKSELKSEYYNINPIREVNCQYNMIMGERSNGKTYSVLEIILTNWWENGKQGAYIRRWKEDYRGKRAVQLFAGHHSENNQFVSNLTGGVWDCVKYYSGKWCLAKQDEELGKVV